MMRSGRFAFCLLTSVIGLLAPAYAQETSALASYHAALRTVERAVDAHGGVAAIRDSGVTIKLEGVFDLTTRLQGRSIERNEPTPITERIVADPAGGRLNYEINWFNYVTSNQQLREIYDNQGRVLFLDRRTKSGGYLPRETVADAQERYRRVLPQFLLTDALAQRQTLQHLGVVRIGAQNYERASYTTEAGDSLTLMIDPNTNLLARASAVIDMPLLGDTEVEWRWDRYQENNDLLVPGRYRVFLGGVQMKSAQMSVSLGVEADDFRAPADYSVGPPPDTLAPLDDFIPYGERPPIVETIAPGIHMITSLRPGFRLMFVEFDDFTLAVDAPTGWYEMQQVPPMNWSFGDGTSALGEKYLRAIKETAPDKPLRYLVLTHHHSDHIGGIRPFVAEGVEILAGLNAAEMARRAAEAMFTLSSDALTGADAAPNVTLVEGIHTIEHGDMAVRLIELPSGNPKADHYLMVYLPRQKILYTTAFIYPVPEAAFPPPESVDLSIYFVEWLDQSGLDIDRIYNVHAGGLVEDWQLDKIREIARHRSSTRD